MDNSLEKVYKSVIKFLQPLVPEETYQLVTEEAMRLVGADYGSILFWQDGQFKRLYASSPHLFTITTRKKGFMYEVLKKRKMKILTIEQIGKIHPEMKKLKIRVTVGIPLSYRSKSVGVLSMMSRKEGYFTPDKLSILRFFAPIASLAITKTQLHDETKKALESRDLFISMAAHELRTPITTINGYSQLLYSKLAGADKLESRWVSELSWEIKRLTLLVKDLLEIDRIKRGLLHYSFQECSLREIIRRAMADFRFSQPGHKLVLQDSLNGSSGKIIGDFDRLLQLTINLLDNAAKFSPTDSEIMIKLTAKKPYIYLTVQDHGSGISKKDLPMLSQKFYRGSGSGEGMGLGLFLAKNILEEHHGEMKIRSQEKKGTRIEVRLPESKND